MSLRHLLLAMVSLVSFVQLGAQPTMIPIDTLLYPSAWTGYICLQDDSITNLRLEGNETKELWIGSAIVQPHGRNRINPLCHPLKLEGNQSYVLYAASLDLGYVISETEVIAKDKSTWMLNWYFYFYLASIVMMFLCGVIALLLYFIYRNKVFLLYAGYIIFYTLFLCSTYEPFFLFESISTYSTMVSEIDVVFTVVGIIFYNHLILALLDPSSKYQSLFKRNNYILILGGLVCIALYTFHSWELGYHSYNVLSLLIIINIAMMIFLAWKTKSQISGLVVAGSLSLISFAFLAVILLLSQNYYGPNAIQHPLFFVLIGFLIEVGFFTSALVIHTRRQRLQLDEIKQLQKEPTTINREPGNNNIAISTAKNIQYINIKDIIRCEAQGAYCRYILKGGDEVLVSQTLKTQEKLLPDKLFFRCHQSHLINLAEVRIYKRMDQSIEMSDNSSVPLSRVNKENFLEAMQEQ